MSTHMCPISVCDREVFTDKLLCVQHWRMVPRPLQKALYRTWQYGRGEGTIEHLAAMKACISAVETQLGGT